MSTNQISKARVIAGGLAFRNDGTSTIYGVYHGTMAVDPGSIASVTAGEVDITITGLASGDAVIVEMPGDLNDDLVYMGYEISAADTLTLHIYNPTGGAIDDTETTWRYTWLDLTA